MRIAMQDTKYTSLLYPIQIKQKQNQNKTKHISMNLYNEAPISVRDTSIFIITFKQALILLAMEISPLNASER
ncbi:hypothetical protein LFZ92_13460 [Salmonella enterica subsp. salamae serovar 57:z29:z42]|nr:hypothetical protein LFZ92_13460 [Salmonella enterica subsp. salamae serovar 57:z29:z42]